MSAPDELGWTALHWAALNGAEPIARRLLALKAQPDAQAGSEVPGTGSGAGIEP